MSRRREGIVTTSLRMPQDLHEDLERIARRDYRTLTGQILMYLQHMVDEDKRRHGETPPEGRDEPRP